MPGSEMMTQREAVTLLGRHGVANRQARDVLRAGLAGAPLRVGNVCLYGRAAVEELAARPQMTPWRLDEICPNGVFVARRAWDVTADRATQLAAVSDGWRLSPWTALWLSVRVSEHSPMPLVATVAGFVWLGADIVAVERAATSESLVLAEPGPWFDDVRGRRIQTGPGRAWVIRGLPGSVAQDARTPIRLRASAPTDPRPA